VPENGEETARDSQFRTTKEQNALNWLVGFAVTLTRKAYSCKIGTVTGKSDQAGLLISQGGTGWFNPETGGVAGGLKGLRQSDF
jgi:hypothetical protein